MNRITKSVGTALVGAVLLTGALTACSGNEYTQRKELQKNTGIKGTSLEETNLQAKLKREEDPNAIRYVYLTTFGNFVGYYTIKGKVSSSGSQLGPEEEIIRGYGGDGYVLDSAQDDGTYGDGDPGIFFFTTDGAMVETSMDYVISDQPIATAIQVPELG
jgi:hypothetical protein